MRNFVKILLILECLGLGDCISSLPALSALTQEHSVTVYGRSFYKSLYERAGCSFIAAAGQTQSEAFTRHFDKSYWLAEWSSIAESREGKTQGPRMEYFAGLIGATLPETFDYMEYLRPNKIDAEYYLLAGQSVETWRSLPVQKEKELFGLLDSVLPTKQLPRVYVYNNKVDGSDLNLQQLIDTVYNARQVVAVEGGILHLARAMNVPSVGLYGMTGPEVMEQYRRYIPDLNHTPITGPAVPYKTGTCTQPCYRNFHNGFNGECGHKLQEPYCMTNISTTQIMEAVNA